MGDTQDTPKKEQQESPGIDNSSSISEGGTTTASATTTESSQSDINRTPSKRKKNKKKKRKNNSGKDSKDTSPVPNQLDEPQQNEQAVIRSDGDDESVGVLDEMASLEPTTDSKKIGKDTTELSDFQTGDKIEQDIAETSRDEQVEEHQPIHSSNSTKENKQVEATSETVHETLIGNHENCDTKHIEIVEGTQYGPVEQPEGSEQEETVAEPPADKQETELENKDEIHGDVIESLDEKKENLNESLEEKPDPPTEVPEETSGPLKEADETLAEAPEETQTTPNQTPVGNADIDHDNTTSICFTEQTNDNQPIDDHKVIISNGPYSMVELVSNIPLKNPDVPEFDNQTMSYIESWDMNLYIGTNCGEIIHMYKIDDELGYIQVSRQRFSSSKMKPIDNILLMPEISKALILSGGTLSAYILPELSPANIGKIRDVTDISIDYDELHLDINERNYITPIDHINGEVFVKVTVFTKKSIRLIRIFDEGMKLFKDVHYPQSIQGIQRSKFAAVGTKTNYDLIDLVQVQKIPLFPVSTVPRNTHEDGSRSEWKPIICPVGKSEFLMTCGGISMDDPSMGMVVNLNGDVSRGTIAWSSYPTSLCVDFPYTISVFNNNELLIHSLHDQSEVQSIRFPKGSIVGVKSGVHIFQSKNSELSHLLTKIPIITKSTPEEIQRVAEENDLAFEKYVSNSSCLIYDSVRSCIKLLKPQPKPIRLLHLYEAANEHNKQLIFEELADELKEETRSGNEEEKSQIEKEFHLTLLGLLALKFNMFDQCFEIWGGNLTKLDPRILIYILSNSADKIKGSVWQFQGLVEKIGELKVQYEKEKENEFLKLFLNTCISSESIVNVDVMKTIEICLIETNIDSDDILGILNQIKLSSNDAIEILLFKKKYYYLAKYYEYLKDHHQFLYYWKMLLNGECTDNEYTKHFKDPKKSLHYLINYLITNCYKDDSTIWKYGEWLLVKYPEFGYLLLTNKNLEKTSIKDSKVLQLLVNEPNIKLNYLKYMIIAKNEKQFTGDLILALLSELMKTLDTDKEAVEEELNSLHVKYKTLSIPRISLNKYLKLELSRFSNKYVLELVGQLYNFLSLINKDTRCILNQKPVVDECFKALKDKETIFPILSIMLHYKKVEYEKIVIMFCEIGDFSSAELFANTLQLPDFRIVNNNAASKKVTQSHNSTTEPPLSSSSNLSITEKVRSEKLLMVIFDKYLEMKNSQLIEMFLNSYNLLKDDDMESGGGSEVDIIYKMNKFIQLLERIPDNFPITQIHTFLIRNVIEFQDAANASVLVRNLNRSQTVSLKGLHRDLGS